MEPRDTATFRGFADDLARVSPDELLDVRMRDFWCREGVSTLYVATDSEGGEIYAQWLIDTETEPRFRRPGIHILEPLPRLAADEVFVEGAYTFARNRRQGAMVDGMHQLLSLARDRGARRCLTYVGIDNVPSLRGCAAVGFVPDHIMVVRWRLGTSRVSSRALEAGDLSRWREAVVKARS